MSEKFSLKWNDFQSVVSQSFGLFRQEEDFYDVTLVTEDHIQIAAHKLVLSASSDFFKNILRRNPHSHPLLYLGGVKAQNIHFLLDYIYHGEVVILQEQLEDFLESAQKLDIKGLIKDVREESIKEEKQELTESGNVVVDESVLLNAVKVSLDTTETAKLQDNSEVNEKIKELTARVDGGFICKHCGKISKNYSNHRKHVEIHMEGLSFPCEFCDKKFRLGYFLKSICFIIYFHYFRNRNSLSCHKFAKHSYR